jgi:D-tyrosyl-tRNA(Tyr) deacylase
MRLVVQRVKAARVTVDNSTTGSITTGSIQAGMVVMIGIARPDTPADADYLLDKILGLRIFPDETGRMNRNIVESGGCLLLVSQFTLYGDCRKGRRPSFDRAAPPDQAQVLYDYFVRAARGGPVPVETGIFQATMEVHLINDGPVTILLDSDHRQKETAP